MVHDLATVFCDFPEMGGLFRIDGSGIDCKAVRKIMPPENGVQFTPNFHRLVVIKPECHSARPAFRTKKYRESKKTSSRFFSRDAGKQLANFGNPVQQVQFHIFLKIYVGIITLHENIKKGKEDFPYFYAYLCIIFFCGCNEEMQMIGRPDDTIREIFMAVDKKRIHANLFYIAFQLFSHKKGSMP